MMSRQRVAAPFLLPGCLLAAVPVSAQPSLGDIIPKFAGIGRGSAPACQGSRETVFGGATGGRLAYTMITGDAANSPIVQRGSRNQLIGGSGVAYTW